MCTNGQLDNTDGVFAPYKYKTIGVGRCRIVILLCGVILGRVKEQGSEPDSSINGGFRNRNGNRHESYCMVQHPVANIKPAVVVFELREK